MIPFPHSSLSLHNHSLLLSVSSTLHSISSSDHKRNIHHRLRDTSSKKCPLSLPFHCSNCLLQANFALNFSTLPYIKDVFYLLNVLFVAANGVDNIVWIRGVAVDEVDVLAGIRTGSEYEGDSISATLRSTNEAATSIWDDLGHAVAHWHAF